RALYPRDLPSCPTRRSSDLGFRGLRLRRLDAGHAATAVDAERHVAIDGGAADHAMLIAVVIDCVVLRRAVVPDRDVPGLPVPAQDRKSTRLNSSHVSISYAV